MISTHIVEQGLKQSVDVVTRGLDVRLQAVLAQRITRDRTD